LRCYLTEADRANGFANRFLYFLVQRSKVLPLARPVPGAVLAPLVQALARVVAFARSVGTVERSPETEAAWAAVYPSLSAGEPGLIGAILGRSEAQVLRLSVLYALLDCSPIVKPPHLAAALAVWDFAEASARWIFGKRLGLPIADAILDALTTRASMTTTEIHHLLGRHKSADEIAAALATLVRAGRVRSTVRKTDGRDATVWCGEGPGHSFASFAYSL
jgi:hypothetical protein